MCAAESGVAVERGSEVSSPHMSRAVPRAGELRVDGQPDSVEGGGAGEGGTSQSRLLAGETEAGSGRVPESGKPGAAPWTGRYCCLLPPPFRWEKRGCER